MSNLNRGEISYSIVVVFAGLILGIIFFTGIIIFSKVTKPKQVSRSQTISRTSTPISSANIEVTTSAIRQNEEVKTDENSVTEIKLIYPNLTPTPIAMSTSVAYTPKPEGNKNQTPTTNSTATETPTQPPSIKPTIVSEVISKLGDANGDGTVNDLDYINHWLPNYLSSNTCGILCGDFNNDQKTDELDYIIWLTNYEG